MGKISRFLFAGNVFLKEAVFLLNLLTIGSYRVI